MTMTWRRTIVIALIWHVCQSELSTTTRKVVTANTGFAVQLYKHLSEIALFGENVFFSPFSVSTALATVYAGAKGTTKRQMAEAMNLEDITGNVHEAFRGLIQSFNDPADNYTLRVANGLFGRKGFSFLDTYANLTARCYDANLKTIDFANDPDGSRKHINEWTANKTNQKIKELFKAGTIQPTSVLVIVNAIYFKGGWMVPFDVKNTASAPFYVSRFRPTTVEMMSLRDERFMYGEDAVLDCRIVKLPYAHDKVSMYVFLPNDIDGMHRLEKALSERRLKIAMSNMRQILIDVIIPKFRLTEKANLKAVFMSMGMQDLFDVEAADLSGIDGRHDLFVSDVVHKTYVDVNEAGTEATAATRLRFQFMSEQIGIEPFRADHPFMFLISDTNSGSVLFMGRLNEPPANDTLVKKSGQQQSVGKAGQLWVWIGGFVVAWQLVLLRRVN